jgi:hypothetical protein
MRAGTLNEKDIRAGFSDNPQELRTTCPKCQKKFLANLIIEFQDGEKKTEIVNFICPEQTLDQMKSIKQSRGCLGIKFLSEKNRQLFYNMIRHWGTYNKALQAMNDYMVEK